MIIKVCGMREPENLHEVERLDVDCLGFVFYDRSPRYVSERMEYIEAIGRCKKNKAGVFVNETLHTMLHISELFQLNFLQLHGNETPEVCFKIREMGYFVIKAFSVSTAADFLLTNRYCNCCDYFLFDTQYAGYGGSGKRFDWSLLDAYHDETPFLLSGGLRPDCVDDIKKLEHPQFAGIDLNSGFELFPAMKDVSRLKQFIRKVRQD